MDDAASMAAQALQQSFLVRMLYVIGVLSCVFHLANSLWTTGITWGVWSSATAQMRDNLVDDSFRRWPVVGWHGSTGWILVDGSGSNPRNTKDRTASV